MRDAAPAMRKITREDIECLAVGAWILGTGGGGSPYLGLLNMRRLYAEGYRVPLMSPLDLDDADRVAVVSNMGAPLVGQERLADSRNIARAVAMQEEYSSVKPSTSGASQNGCIERRFSGSLAISCLGSRLLRLVGLSEVRPPARLEVWTIAPLPV